MQNITSDVNDEEFTPIPFVKNNKSSDILAKSEASEEDSILKNLLRKAIQPVKGYAQASPYGLLSSFLDIFSKGEGYAGLDEYSPERIAELKRRQPNAPWENFTGIDQNKYSSNVSNAQGVLPTIDTISSFIENKTGIPTQANSLIDRLLNLSGSGYKMDPGSFAQKAKSAAIAPSISGTAQLAGVPEPIADVLGSVAPGIAKVSGSALKKDSGLKVRRFEDLKKERIVSSEQSAKINAAVKNDFQNLSDDIIGKFNKTSEAIKSDSNFTKKLDSMFSYVKDLAKELPANNLKVNNLYNSVKSKLKIKPSKGYTFSESDLAYNKEMEKFTKQLSKQKNKAIDNSVLLEQYRKNNEALKSFYEPSKSKLFNSGKKQALLDYNEAIAEFWKKNYPGSGFNSFFELSNKVYSDMKGLDTIKGFTDKIFANGKINFKIAKNFNSNDNLKNAYKRVLGDEGFKDMNLLFDDFLSTEKAQGLIKKASNLGFKDIAKLSAKWIVSPIFAKASALLDVGKYVRNSLLSKPKFVTEWSNANKYFKEGKFALAQKAFKNLEEMQDEEKKEMKEQSKKSKYKIVSFD